MCLHFRLRPCREWETAQLDKYPWKRKSGGWIAGGARGCSGDCTAMDLTNRPVRVPLLLSRVPWLCRPYNFRWVGRVGGSTNGVPYGRGDMVPWYLRYLP